MNRYYEKKEIVKDYVKYRPDYNLKVAEIITDFVKKEQHLNYSNDELGFMVDVGCGGGQSTTMFAPYFNKILAIDPSQNQIKCAIQNNICKNITFKGGLAENLPILKNSVDLIVSGEAAQWFDFPLFLKEADRVLKPQGCLALFGYWTPIVTPLFGNHNGKVCHKVSKLLEDYLLAGAKLTNRFANALLVQGKFETFYQAIPYKTKTRNQVVQKTLFNFNQLIGYMRSMDCFDSKPEVVAQLAEDIRLFWKVEDKNAEEITLEFQQEIFIILASKN